MTNAYTVGDITIEFKKDIYNPEYLNELDINSRQVNALLYTKTNGSIASADYQRLNNVGRTVATEELVSLVRMKLLLKEGSIGRSSRYTLPGKI